MAAAVEQAEREIVIQQTTLTNKGRHLLGEDRITHIGLEAYAWRQRS